MKERNRKFMERANARFNSKYPPKFTTGDIEHPGDFKDIGLIGQLLNAEEEVLDQWSFIQGALEDAFALEELVLRMADSPQRTDLLKKVRGLYGDPLVQQLPEDSQPPLLGTPDIQPSDNQETS